MESIFFQTLNYYELLSIKPKQLFLSAVASTLFTSLLNCIAIQTFSQTDSISSKKISVRNTVKSKPRMSNLKFNLTSLSLKNYSLQYERILSRKFSFAVAA